jgi:hypothetical protein
MEKLVVPQMNETRSPLSRTNHRSRSRINVNRKRRSLPIIPIPNVFEILSKIVDLAIIPGKTFNDLGLTPVNCNQSASKISRPWRRFGSGYVREEL